MNKFGSSPNTRDFRKVMNEVSGGKTARPRPGFAETVKRELDAAKLAVRYEKPALLSVDSKVEDKRQYVARIPHASANFSARLARIAPPGDAQSVAVRAQLSAQDAVRIS